VSVFNKKIYPFFCIAFVVCVFSCAASADDSSLTLRNRTTATALGESNEGGYNEATSTSTSHSIPGGGISTGADLCSVQHGATVVEIIKNTQTEGYYQYIFSNGSWCDIKLEPPAELQSLVHTGEYKEIIGGTGTSSGTAQATSGLTMSQAGLQFLAGAEGWRSSCYDDGTGVPTIGYGHAYVGADWCPINGISKEQGLAMLQQDVAWAENAVKNFVKVALTQSQFDALVSLTFNIGSGALAKSSVVRELNAGDYSEAANRMLSYCKAKVNGALTTLQGLVTRRKAEVSMFLGNLI